MTATSIVVGGLTFHGRAATAPLDADGCLWIFSRIDGWHDGPPVKGKASERPAAHGQFAERAWRDGRLVTWSGSVHCPTRALASSVQARLTGLLASAELDTLTVNDPDQGALSARVRLATTPLVDWDIPGGMVLVYQFQVLAPDPFRYGTPVVVSTGFPRVLGGLEYPLFTDGTDDTGVLEYGDPGAETGLIEVTNPGTADAWSVLTVTGPTPPEGFDVLVAGERLRYSERILSGSSLTIDTATGSVRLDGVDRKVALTVREWRAVGPGETASVAFLPLGGATTGQLSVSLAPTYW